MFKNKYILIGLFIGLFLILFLLISYRPGKRIINSQASAIKPSDIVIPQGYNPFRNPRADEKVQEKVKINASVSTATAATVRESVEYIGAQRRSDGTYQYTSHIDYLCKKDPTNPSCTTRKLKDTYLTNTAWSAYAYIGAYQSYTNPAYLEQAVKDILLLRNNCAQNKNDCLWVLVQAATVYDQTGNPFILQFLKEEGEVLLTKTDPNIMLKSIEARELAILYRIFRDKRYINEAIKRASKIHQKMTTDKNTYTTRAPFSYPMESCWYMLANYEITKYVSQPDQQKYIDDIVSFINNADIDANWKAFMHPIEIQPCIELTAKLGALTSSQPMVDYAGRLMSRFSQDFIDSEKNNLNFGEGGTLYIRGPIDPNDIRTRLMVLSDSAYTVYLASLFSK